MLVVVMSLPPEMKKRDRPLVGDSPARFRVPIAGTVSLDGVVGMANGRASFLRKAVCGQAPSCIGPRSSQTGAGEKRNGSRRGAGWGRQRPPCGVLPGGTEPRSSSRRKATTRDPSRALKRPFASRVVNRCLRYDSAGPLSGQGRGQAFAKGLSPRRLRRETSLPGRHRIPRTAATSSVPPSSVGTRAAAQPVPWL